MKRADAVLAVVVALVVVAAVVAGVSAARRGPAHLEAGTPAAVVQTYLQAVSRHDLRLAASQLAGASSCTEADLAQTSAASSFRAVLTSSTTSGDTASVEVAVTEGGGGPLDEGYTHTQWYSLVQDGGRWRLSGTPWPLYACEAVASS